MLSSPRYDLYDAVMEEKIVKCVSGPYSQQMMGQLFAEENVPMNVAKAGGDREVWADGRQSRENSVDILGLCI